MNFTVLYRLSFYLMLFFATLTLSIDDVETPFAMLYPAAVAVASIAALSTVDRNPRLGLDRTLSNWLALGSIALVFAEYAHDPDSLLKSLGHWLVYLQLLKMFLPKRVEDDWFLFLLGLMQVLVGTVGSQSDHIGMSMFTWALLALWVLSLFSLHRDAVRSRALPEQAPESMADPVDPYPGLLNPAFIVAALRVTIVTLALGGVIFLAMPRRSILARTNFTMLPAAHMTGFDEEVKLGQLGEILENDSVVMSIELFDTDRNRIAPPPDPLWRGVTMTLYEGGRWHRQGRSLSSFPATEGGRVGKHRVIRQHIRLEPTNSTVLFGLRPMLNAMGAPLSQRSFPELNAIDGSIVRTESRSRTYDYRVISDIDPDKPQPGELFPGEPGLERLLSVPEEVRGPLLAIADRVVEGIPEESPWNRARALDEYLRDSGQFGYSLRLDRVDPRLDPVVDFAVNSKMGHCGYFASTLVLMLRTIGIPARMVNGFKGGDWNELGKVMSVRQKHAHSWVEALLPTKPGEDPIWVTFDPTPAAQRDEVVASVGGFITHFRQITDLVRYVWIFYIVGYNTDRQRFLIYEPILRLIEQGRRGFQMMGQASRSAMTGLFGFSDLSAFISVRGFFVSFVGLLALVGLARGAWWVACRLWRWYRGDPEESASLSASQVFYRRLTQLLAEFGLDRPPAETQLEFAHRASAFLTGRGSSTVGVADVPMLVVLAYYRVRFGHGEIAPIALEHLDRRLDALEASLHANAE